MQLMRSLETAPVSTAGGQMNARAVWRLNLPYTDSGGGVVLRGHSWSLSDWAPGWRRPCKTEEKRSGCMFIAGGARY